MFLLTVKLYLLSVFTRYDDDSKYLDAGELHDFFKYEQKVA